MGKEFKSLYTTVDSVKQRLINKVQFQATESGPIDGELPNSLLYQLIEDAETQVESDLRSRYTIPFQSIKFGNFNNLPDHTKRQIRMAVDMAAVIQILNADFGRGTHIDGKDYFENTEKMYTKQIDRLLGRDQEAANDKRDRFRYSPPLDDLLLAFTNREADNGFRGKIINTDGNTHDDPSSYAGEQINNPAKSYIKKPGWGQM